MPATRTRSHRAATPLELLFDLTFVVAVAAVVTELAHAIVDGHPAEGLVGYLVVFFAIWWAWMNFTWFASAFDCDDAFYRVLTMLQMVGVLVLATGIAPFFERSEFGIGVLGYVLMRIALVTQWLRVAWSVPEYRDVALRYAIPIAAVQLLWIVRLTLPYPFSASAFLALIVVELLIPWFAERRTMTPWNAHHIVERFGLFTIIVLGESVLAATTAILVARSETGLSLELAGVALSGLVLLFACWWLYFLESDAHRLDTRRDLAFSWGYGHYFVFASLAAIGAGIEVTVEAVSHDVVASPLLVGFSVAVPLAIFLAVRYALYARIGGDHLVRLRVLAGEVGVVLVIPLASVALRPAGVIALLAAAAAGLIVYKSYRFGLIRHGAGADTRPVSAADQDAPHDVAEGPESRQGRPQEPSETEAAST